MARRSQSQRSENRARRIALIIPAPASRMSRRPRSLRDEWFMLILCRSVRGASVLDEGRRLAHRRTSNASVRSRSSNAVHVVGVIIDSENPAKRGGQLYLSRWCRHATTLPPIRTSVCQLPLHTHAAMDYCIVWVGTKKRARAIRRAFYFGRETTCLRPSTRVHGLAISRLPRLRESARL